MTTTKKTNVESVKTSTKKVAKEKKVDVKVKKEATAIATKETKEKTKKVTKTTEDKEVKVTTLSSIKKNTTPSKKKEAVRDEKDLKLAKVGKNSRTLKSVRLNKSEEALKRVCYEYSDLTKTVEIPEDLSIMHRYVGGNWRGINKVGISVSKADAPKEAKDSVVLFERYTVTKGNVSSWGGLFEVNAPMNTTSDKEWDAVSEALIKDINNSRRTSNLFYRVFVYGKKFSILVHRHARTEESHKVQTDLIISNIRNLIETGQCFLPMVDGKYVIELK